MMGGLTPQASFMTMLPPALALATLSLDSSLPTPAITTPLTVGTIVPSGKPGQNFPSLRAERRQPLFLRQRAALI
jgi:hypothetical protein